MAGLQERKGSYRISFRYRGKQHFVTLGKVSEPEARAKSAQADYLLLRLEQRLLELPAGVDIVAFILQDGKVPVAAAGNEGVAKTLTRSAFRDRYLDTHQPSIEPRTREGLEPHFNHLIGALGERFPLQVISDN